MINFLILCSIIVLSLIFRKSRIVEVIDFVFLYIWMAFASVNLADRNVYISKYINSDLWGSATEYLFNSFLQFCQKNGLTISQFFQLLSLLILLILFLGIHRLTNNQNVVLACYMIFYYCIDTVQLRFAIAGAVVVLAFSFLFKKSNNWKNYLYFGLLILVASMFHASAIACEVYLLVPILNIKKSVLIAIIIGILGIVTVRTGWIIWIIGYFLGGKVQVINSDYSINMQLYTVFRVIIVCLEYVSFMLVWKRNKDTLAHGAAKGTILNESKRINRGLIINIICLSVIGLIPFAVDWYRIQQPVVMLNYCIYASCLLPEQANSWNKRNIKLLTFMLIVAIVNFYLLVGHSASLMNSIVHQLLFENQIL